MIYFILGPMNTHTISFIIITLLLSICRANSQPQELVLDLDRTTSIACDSSLQAYSAKNAYLSSYWEYRSYRAARLPSLMLTMTPIEYNRSFISRYDSETNTDVYRRQQSIYTSGNMSIKQNFDLTGGTFFIDSELGYVRNFGENTTNQFSSVPLRIGYSQNLFGFNSFKWEKKIEPIKYEKAKKKYLYTVEQVSETAAQYFFSLAMAQAEYDLAKNNISSSDSLYHMGMERQKIASISQADLLTLKLDVINAGNSLKNAEISLKKAMFSFVSYLNLDGNTKIRLLLPEKPTRMELSPEKALEQVRKNNPDLLENRQELLEAEQVVEKTKKSANFDASLYASVGFNQVASTIGGSYKDPLQQDIITVGVQIPLVDWGVRKGKVNMARNNLNVTRISVKQDELSLQEDILMTVNDFNVQQDLIQSAEEAMGLANMAFEATKQRFLIGKADVSSLTLALNRQESAHKNYISALQNYWISYYKIRKLTLFDFDKNQPLNSNYEKL